MKIWIFSMCFWHFLAPKTMNRRFRSFGKVLKGQKSLFIAEKSLKYHISEHLHHFCLRHLRKSSTFLMFLRFSKVQTISDKIETYSGHSREHAYKMKEPTPHFFQASILPCGLPPISANKAHVHWQAPN